MTFISAITNCWLGLCRKVPVVHTSTALTPCTTAVGLSLQPGAGRNIGSPGGIRRGISIAAESIRALLHEKQLLGFSLLAGIVILVTIFAEQWNLMHIDASYTASSLITIPFGNTYLIVFDFRFFLIEAVCLSGFTLLLAALVHYRSAMRETMPATFRRMFSAPHRYTGALAVFSIAMAFVATILLEISAQNQFTGTTVSAISRAMFWLPYAYYFSPNGIFTTLFHSFRMMVANTVLFVTALYVVPAIVLENKGLLPALAGSIRLMIRTWRELLGCVLVFGTIILAVAFIGLIIGQSPALLNYDYDFFIQVSRGQALMTAICYGFLLACGALMALGSTVLGVAVTDLYICGTGTGKRTMPPENRAPADRGYGL